MNVNPTNFYTHWGTAAHGTSGWYKQNLSSSLNRSDSLDSRSFGGGRSFGGRR